MKFCALAETFGISVHPRRCASSTCHSFLAVRTSDHPSRHDSREINTKRHRHTYDKEERYAAKILSQRLSGLVGKVAYSSSRRGRPHKRSWESSMHATGGPFESYMFFHGEFGFRSRGGARRQASSASTGPEYVQNHRLAELTDTTSTTQLDWLDLQLQLAELNQQLDDARAAGNEELVNSLREHRSALRLKAKLFIVKEREREEQMRAQEEKLRAQEEKLRAREEKSAEKEKLRAQGEKSAEKEKLRAQEEKLRAREEKSAEKEKLRAQEEKLRAKEEKLRAQEEKLRAREEKSAENEKLRAQEEKLRAREEKLKAENERLRAETNGYTEHQHLWSVLPHVQSTELSAGLMVFQIPNSAIGALQSVRQTAPYGRSDCLVVRRSGQLFARRVVAAINSPGNAKPSFVLSGNPGTGKSVWRNYMLKLCHDNGFTVMEHNLKDSPKFITLLQPGRPAYRRKTDARTVYLNLLGDDPECRVLYLCDTGDNCRIEPNNLPCVTVLTSSPNRRHFSGFVKEGADPWYWPTWTWEELAAARRYLFTPTMTEEKLRSRYDQVGGVLRSLVLGDEQFMVYTGLMDSSIGSMTPTSLLKLARASLFNKVDQSVSSELHKLFQVVPYTAIRNRSLPVGIEASPLSMMAQVLPISDWVHQELSRRLLESSVEEAATWWYHMMAWQGLRAGVDVGWQFEAVFFRLSTAGTLPGMAEVPVGGRNSSQLIAEDAKSKGLSPPYMVKARDGMDLFQKHVLYQAADNTGAIDGWLCERVGDRDVLWLLQLTAAKDHSIGLGPLAFAMRALRQGAWADAEVRLAFVVPWWQAGQYLPKPQKVEMPKDAGVGDKRYYVPSSSEWRLKPPKVGAKESMDVNGLQAEPFTMEEAMRDVGALKQWVWVCGLEAKPAK